jgi:methionyl-tRNA formyltransferase
MQTSPVKEVALAHGIPIYQPRSLRSEEAAVPLRDWQPDVIVVAAFGQILRPHVLELPPSGCINVHASLLPRWRGASPIQHAIMAGDMLTGITLMQMDEGLDTGPMYVQETITITADDTSATVHDRLAQLGAALLSSNLATILRGDLTAQAQDDSLATYAPMIKKDDGQIDWERSAAEIDRLVRAMTPWPGAYTDWEGQNLKILSAYIGPDLTLNVPPGTVLQIDGGPVVQTGDGTLALDRLQLAGKKAMEAAEFVRGRPQFDRVHLGT